MGLAARVLRWLRAPLLAGLCSGVTVTLACEAVLLTTEPAWVNLALEPLSLLLLPGLAAAMVWTAVLGQVRHAGNLGNSHDFTASLVISCSAVFYFLVFVFVFRRSRLQGGRQGLVRDRL